MIACKDRKPPCPANCVTVNYKTGKVLCRAKPTKSTSAAAKPTAVASKPTAVASKPTAAVAKPTVAAKPVVKYVPLAISKPVIKPEHKLTSEQLALRASRAAKKAERESNLDLASEEFAQKYTVGMFNTATMDYRRKVGMDEYRKQCSDYGYYVAVEVKKALADAGLSQAQIETAMNDERVATYIRLRCKLTMDELEIIRSEVLKVSQKIELLKNEKGKISPEKEEQVKKIIDDARVCKYIILESGRVVKSAKAKMVGEASVELLKPFAKSLGIKKSNLNKAELCFAMAQIISLDEHQFITAFLEREPKKEKAAKR